MVASVIRGRTRTVTKTETVGRTTAEVIHRSVGEPCVPVLVTVLVRLSANLAATGKEVSGMPSVDTVCGQVAETRHLVPAPDEQEARPMTRRRSGTRRAARGRAVRKEPWLRARWALAAGGIAFIAGCGGSGHATVTDGATGSASPTSTPSISASGQHQVLDQYRAFWAELTPASHAVASRRRAMLEPFAADPELKSLVQGMARDRANGRVFYGQPVVRASVTQFSEVRGIAVVRDCQDATHTGDKDARTGRVLTKGTAHTLVVATLHKLATSWRVVFVSFPRQSC